MIPWKGKIIGALIGVILGGPIGLVLGLFIGHLFDQGYFQLLRGTTGSADQVQKVFFDSTFTIMGYLAKSDGRVSQHEIQIAERIMAQMNLNAEMRKEAIRLFNLGKQADFNLTETMTRLKRTCWRHPNLLRTFLEIQLQTTYADGQLTAAKKMALQRVCAQLGISGFSFDQFEQQYRAGQNYQRHSHQAQKNPKAYLHEAYAILGVNANTNDADVKKAYRRLMSKHHPDKLVSQGVPPEMIKLATQKTQQIKDAYNTIKQARGIK